jgi:phage/plasmid-like protein (TIGR03299 family)
MQNEYMTDMLDRVVEDAQGIFSSTADLDGGRKVAVTMQLPGMAKIGGSDLVDTYLAAMTSHDGKTGTTFMVTPVHRSSMSTLNLSFKNVPNLFRVKHTRGANRTLAQQVKEALEFTYNYLDEFELQAGRLAATKLSQGDFERIITKEFGAPSNAPAPTITRTQNKLDLMARLFANKHDEPTGGTAWAGLTALAEWFDHHSHVRPDGGSEVFARSRRAIFEPGFKNDALALMLGLVK